MDKYTTLASLRQHVASGEITRPEVDEVFRDVREVKGPTQISFSQVLYYIGAGIVLIGIFILVAQNWMEFNATARLLVTLGSGIAAYIVAALFMQRQTTKQIAPAFFLMSAILIPIGLGVLFDKAGYDIGGSGIQVIISLILTALYSLSYYVYRKNVLMLFIVAFASWAFFAFSNLIIGESPLARNWHLYSYLIMALGIGYMIIGRSFEKTPRGQITGVLYFFGILGFLGGAITLNGFWEVIYAGLALGAILLSTYFRSRSFLVFGSLFLMGYLIKITVKYFGDSLNWPLALVLAGLMLIGVGYFTFYLNKKYLSNNEAVRS